ncbi:hypothetical protein AA313_de0204663 [Arthrobotrys entomopaga]|nr:hypothetical protein AA313_de0204663 [Arthrobotrys entomopaga]
MSLSQSSKLLGGADRGDMLPNQETRPDLNIQDMSTSSLPAIDNMIPSGTNFVEIENQTSPSTLIPGIHATNNMDSKPQPAVASWRKLTGANVEKEREYVIIVDPGGGTLDLMSYQVVVQKIAQTFEHQTCERWYTRNIDISFWKYFEILAGYTRFAANASEVNISSNSSPSISSGSIDNVKAKIQDKMSGLALYREIMVYLVLQPMNIWCFFKTLPTFIYGTFPRIAIFKFHQRNLMRFRPTTKLNDYQAPLLAICNICLLTIVLSSVQLEVSTPSQISGLPCSLYTYFVVVVCKLIGFIATFDTSGKVWKTISLRAQSVLLRTSNYYLRLFQRELEPTILWSVS